MTISLCMIVKDEAARLRRCLESVAGLMDEIIIVDTGSADNTKEIAAEFTDRIYDFAWQDDFAAARNFAFSKATMDYIYSADADEEIDAFNYQRFASLKQALLPEIEIVQMHYVTPPDYNTTSNYKKEYRPKLYKRLREFVWVDAVHETVRLDPVVYDSDIEILHLPDSLHSGRDFAIFLRIYEREGRLSAKLHSMLAKELFISGTDGDFAQMQPIFLASLQSGDLRIKREAVCVLCHLSRVQGNTDAFFSYAFRLMPDALCAELCYEIGSYFLDRKDYEEAMQWFDSAAHGTEAVIDARRGGEMAVHAFQECCKMIALRVQEQEPYETEKIAYYLELAEST